MAAVDSSSVAQAQDGEMILLTPGTESENVASVVSRSLVVMRKKERRSSHEERLRDLAAQREDGSEPCEAASDSARCYIGRSWLMSVSWSVGRSIVIHRCSRGSHGEPCTSSLANSALVA